MTSELEQFDRGELLGSGASADVFRAVHRRQGLAVALKVWRRALSGPESERFDRECRAHRAAAAAAEGRVVGIYWAEAIPGTPAWIAMELFEESLASRLVPNREPLSWAERLAIADDVLVGLAAIHNQQVLHRDLKPANVLLRRGRAALGDLGLALHADGVTVDAAAGTGYYLADELRRGGSPNLRTDVYSMGVTLRRLFGENSPSALDNLLERSVSVHPGDRPADGAELLRMFRNASRGGAGHPEAPVAVQLRQESPRAVAASARRWHPGRNPWRKIIVGAAVFCAAAGVAYLAASRETGSSGPQPKPTPTHHIIVLVPPGPGPSSAYPLVERTPPLATFVARPTSPAVRSQ